LAGSDVTLVHRSGRGITKHRGGGSGVLAHNDLRRRIGLATTRADERGVAFRKNALQASASPIGGRGFLGTVLPGNARSTSDGAPEFFRTIRRAELPACGW